MANEFTKLFNATVLGYGPSVVSSVPMIRTQGNGNFAGFDRITYSDGSVINHTFTENAASREAVQAAYYDTHKNIPA